ncbi:MAG: 5'-methylthioadenosine/S-adenosylhomocysteine nucleosidase [Acholeplasmataceae bacterium]|jgi:adenosylhomocysteine nucleosidase|nr:5'-methylthioadenosine/S-adenosylhomocysteine nucleosidase [Acholeplasmataceae bacterium]
MILIVCAMENEASEIKKVIDNIDVEYLTDSKFYYYGTIKEKPVILIVTGIGKVNAAVFTSLMLAKQKFDYIINLGFAGALNPYKVGDQVVIKDASYHDVDLTEISELYEYGQIPEMPHPFLSDFELVRKATFSLGVSDDSLFTGDRFITQKVLPTPGIYDMEGAAIYQAAHIFKTKVVSVKLISDIIESESQTDDYKDFKIEAPTILKDMLLKII